MDLGPHLWEALGVGLVTVEVEFHDVVTFARFGSRKALTQHCESSIAAALSDLNAGRRPGAPRRASP